MEQEEPLKYYGEEYIVETIDNCCLEYIIVRF